MTTNYFFLADSAQVADGKLFVLGGGISILWRNQYPAPMDVALVVMFEHSAAEAGNASQVEVRINDADSRPIDLAPFAMQMTLGDRPEGVPITAPLCNPFAIQITGPVIPQPGAYEIEIVVDGVIVGTIPFTVAIPQAHLRAA